MIQKNKLFELLTPEVLGQSSSRRDALRGAGKLSFGLAAASVPALFTTLASRAQAQQAQPTVTEVLNFALTLEELEYAFYEMGLNSAGLIPAEFVPVFQTIEEHEDEHRMFLREQLGDDANPVPTFDFTAGGMFPDVFTNFQTFALLAQAFEDTGVRAYKGQAPNLIENDEVLAAALSIHSVEGRHASKVRRIRGLQGWIPFAQPGAPAAVQPTYAGEDQRMQADINVPAVSGISAESVTESFDEPLTMQQVLEIADPFIVG